MRIGFERRGRGEISGLAGDTPASTPLSRGQFWLRAAVLIALGLAATALRAVDPGSLSFLPFRTSCGAVTGLPCIFCGTTRALHHLLNGDFAHALYFNWLAFPVSALAIGVAALFAMELALGRRVLVVSRSFQFTPRMVALSGGALVLLWIFQVALVVSQGKRDLLNASGLLYSLLLK